MSELLYYITTNDIHWLIEDRLFVNCIKYLLSLDLKISILNSTLIVRPFPGHSSVEK